MKKYNLAIVKILGYFGLPMYDYAAAYFFLVTISMIIRVLFSGLNFDLPYYSTVPWRQEPKLNSKK